MAGLDPAIHVFLPTAVKTWVAGSGPAMTSVRGPMARHALSISSNTFAASLNAWFAAGTPA